MKKFLNRLTRKRYMPRLFKNFIRSFLELSWVGRTMQLSFTVIIIIAMIGLLTENVCYGFIFLLFWALYEINPK